MPLYWPRPVRIESLGTPVADERMARSADLQAQRTSKFLGFGGVVEDAVGPPPCQTVLIQINQ